MKTILLPSLIIAALVSWGIALTVFAPFALYCMKQPLRLVGAVCFIFRTPVTGA